MKQYIIMFAHVVEAQRTGGAPKLTGGKMSADRDPLFQRFEFRAKGPRCFWGYYRPKKSSCEKIRDRMRKGIFF
jgi:hypothetical protein